MAISTKQLEVFIAVIECGTVTAAAERLYLSQPAVSRSLDRFQHEAGFKVFEKRGSRLVVTDSGSAFYAQVKRYYSGLDKINQVARDLAADRSGSIRLGVFAGWANEWIASRIEHYFIDRDKIEISIETRDSNTLIDLVISQALNFAITINKSSHTGVESQRLFVDKCVCIVPPGHRLIDHTEIDHSDLDDESVISFGKYDPFQLKVNEYLKPNQTIRRRINTAMASTACHLVARGMGFAMVPKTTADEFSYLGYFIKPLAVDIDFPIYLITPKHGISSNIVKNFIGELSVSP